MFKVFLFLIAGASTVLAQNSEPETAPLPQEAPAPEQTAAEPAGQPSTIVYDGQTFELAKRTATAHVQTDEYVVSGEKIADWTQLLTVQRLALSKAAGTDEFLAYFRGEVARDGATLDAIKQGKTASVFAVRFPKSERNEEQVMICLAFIDRASPLRLNIVQYAIKPTRTAVSVVEMRIRAWRDKLVRQAQEIGEL